ncbi:MAG: winged helix-turn-helix domain-containing protein [Novosphingobium sp.]
MPAAFDLRRLGWRLADHAAGTAGDTPCPQLVLPAGLSLRAWLALVSAPRPQLGRTVMLGIDDPHARARLLRMGFGDALGWGVALHELETRIARMVERAEMVPRLRQAGALRLDLLAREAFVAGRAVGLHPREFALLWRLADVPGNAVSQRELLGDVWRLSFRPETNSLAVHVSRLRAKLRLSGLDGLVETLPDGAYRLAVGPPGTGTGTFALDAPSRLGKEHRYHPHPTIRQDTTSCAMK